MRIGFMKALSFVPSLAAVSFVVSFLLAVPAGAKQASERNSSSSTAKDLLRLEHLANEAHMQGDVSKEIEYRRSYSEKAWAAQPQNGSVDKYLLIFLNDMPLAILLEGSHKWPEAEALFRHNQSQLVHERLAGNDIKSENDLHLAHLLEREGKQEEASRICAYWERRVKRIGQDAVFDAEHDDLWHPPYDSPEVETGKWDLACGRTEDGTRLLKEQMVAYPRMSAPYTVVSEYSFAEGDFEKGRRAETEADRALVEGPELETEMAYSKRELN